MVNGRDIPITLAELRERLMEMEHTLLTTGVTSSASSSSTHVTVSVKGQVCWIFTSSSLTHETILYTHMYVTWMYRTRRNIECFG